MDTGENLVDDDDSEYYARAREIALRIAVRRTRGSLRAQDVAQNAMIRLMKETRRPDNLEAWLTTIVNNLANDKWRADGRRKERIAGDDLDERDVPAGNAQLSPSFWALEPAYYAQMMEELGRVLSPKELQVLQLTADGLSQAEIAEELGYANAATVKTTLARARKKLKELGDDRFADWVEHPRAY